jgi:hypothetical protein
MALRDIFLFIFGLILIGTLGYIVFLARSEASSCLAQPLNYGIKQLESNNRGIMECDCMLMNDNRAINIKANSTALWSPQTSHQDSQLQQDLNLGLLGNLTVVH